MNRKFKLAMALLLILPILVQTTILCPQTISVEERNAIASVQENTAQADATQVTSATEYGGGIVAEEEYYILNAGTNALLTTQYSHDSAGNAVVVGGRSASSAYRWKIYNPNSTMAAFIRVDSPTNKAISFYSNSVQMRSYIYAAYQFFTIQRIESGLYQGLYTIRYGDQYLTAPSSLGSLGYGYVYLSSELTQYSVWSFMIADKDFADIWSFTYEDYDSSVNDENFALLFNTLGYVSTMWNNSALEDAYEYMQLCSDVWVYRGHGGEGRIAFYNSSGCYGRILADSAMRTVYSANSYCIDEMNSDALDYAHVVLYLGCSTGNDYISGGTRYNLLDATYEKGAHFVLGTTAAVKTDDSNEFLLGFMQGVANGLNVSECVDRGILLARSNQVYQYGDYPVIKVGDSYQYLNFTPITINFDTEDILG